LFQSSDSLWKRTAPRLSKNELNDLAVVKERLIASDACAIEEARSILGKDVTSAKDDAAQRVALEAFARFGDAASRTWEGSA